jgi:Acyl-CoA oxidase
VLFLYLSLSLSLSSPLVLVLLDWKKIRRMVRKLCVLIRPDAVGYVDAFGMSDYFLNSALGRYDGDVYRALYEWAQVGNKWMCVCFV